MGVGGVHETTLNLGPPSSDAHPLSSRIAMMTARGQHGALPPHALLLDGLRAAHQVSQCLTTTNV